MQLITSISDISISTWSSFVQNHPNGTLFHTPEYYEVFRDEKYAKSFLFAVINNEHEIEAISVIVIHREKNTFTGYFSRRAIAMAPPICKNNNERTLHFLLKEQIIFLRNKAIYYEIRNCRESNYNVVFKENLFRIYHHLNNVIDLSVDFMSLSKKIISTARGKARKAIRKQVQVRIVDYKKEINAVYNVMDMLYRDLHVPHLPKTVYKNGLVKLLESQNLVIFGAYLDDKLISTMLLILYKNEAYSWYMGSLKQYKSYSANDLLVIETLRYAKEFGITQYNWGGAGVPGKEYGVRNFKEKFGGETIQEFRYVKVFKPHIYKIARLALSIIRK